MSSATPVNVRASFSAHLANKGIKTRSLMIVLQNENYLYGGGYGYGYQRRGYGWHNWLISIIVVGGESLLCDPEKGLGKLVLMLATFLRPLQSFCSCLCASAQRGFVGVDEPVRPLSLLEGFPPPIIG